jgi:hypothetical protein
MVVKLFLVNTSSGQEHIPQYVDANEIVSWGPWLVPDPLPQGINRGLRGRTLIVLNFKSGMMHWCEEGFDAVSARILAARGQLDEAKVHEAAAAASATRSPLAVV